MLSSTDDHTASAPDPNLEKWSFEVFKWGHLFLAFSIIMGLFLKRKNHRHCGEGLIFCGSFLGSFVPVFFGIYVYNYNSIRYNVLRSP